MSVKCPSCDGEKSRFVFVNTGPDSSKHHSGMYPCFTCAGSGSITDEHSARIKSGRVRRNFRLANGLTLSEAARILGISASDLSAIERGCKTLDEALPPGAAQ